MALYKVISSRLGVFKQGQTVDENDLASANIVALLDGGHIAEVGSKKFKKDNDEQPKVEE